MRVDTNQGAEDEEEGACPLCERVLPFVGGVSVIDADGAMRFVCDDCIRLMYQEITSEQAERIRRASR
jgi:hypothetical protein